MVHGVCAKRKFKFNYRKTNYRLQKETGFNFKIILMEIINSKIEGVKIIKKNQIIDDRGSVMHMLRNDDENFKKFGEIYFSSVNPKFIKAWHLHENDFKLCRGLR